jgi:hypothetical protein
MLKKAHIVLLLVLAAIASCRGPRVIPREDMVDIYVEMFLSDQRIREDAELRRQADTMLVYEPIFNRHGYTTDDYLFTLQNNLKDPERFAKTLQEVTERLKSEGESIGREIDHLEWIEKLMGMARPPLDSLLAPFGKDSLYVGVARVARDSGSAAWFRLVGVRKDTLMVPVDSVATVTDTLKHE